MSTFSASFVSRTSWRSSVAAPAVACATPLPSVVRGGFDGPWSVSATGNEGGCSGPDRHPIVVRDGIVEEDGSLVDFIESGLADIAAEGRLAASTGSGRRSLADPASRSGRSTATRAG